MCVRRGRLMIRRNGAARRLAITEAGDNLTDDDRSALREIADLEMRIRRCRATILAKIQSRREAS
jgi:uncharacterized membrane protein